MMPGDWLGETAAGVDSALPRRRAYFTNTMTLGQFILMDFLKRKTRSVRTA